MSHENWFALESNPEVINEYVQKLGFQTTDFQFMDLYSTEEWAQQMIPQPCLGVLLNFPHTTAHLQHSQEQGQKIIDNGQIVDESVIHMEQNAQNACGTVGLFHILMNLNQEYKKYIEKDSILEKTINDFKGKSSKERAKLFQESSNIKEAHKKAISDGQSEVKEQVSNHFISLIYKNGHCYEMDGQKQFPINHGECTEESFLGKACQVLQEFMQRDPSSIQFSIIVLAKKNQLIQQNYFYYYE